MHSHRTSRTERAGRWPQRGAPATRDPRRATAYTAPPRQTRTHRKPTVHTERDERAPELRGETINNDVESFA
jgi:hypothetical protein